MDSAMQDRVDEVKAARQAGRDAHLNGQWLDANPYADGPALLCVSWRHGWADEGPITDNVEPWRARALGIA